VTQQFIPSADYGMMTNGQQQVTSGYYQPAETHFNSNQMDFGTADLLHQAVMTSFSEFNGVGTVQPHQ